MRWRLHFSKFTFHIVDKKGNGNILTDSISRLKFFEHTTMPLNEDIPTYSDDITSDEDQATLVPHSDVLDHIFLTQEDMQKPPPVPITAVKMVWKHQNDHFCCDIVTSLRSDEDLAFSPIKRASSSD